MKDLESKLYQNSQYKKLEEKLRKELDERYPMLKESEIKEIQTIFSFIPHATKKYIVLSKINIADIINFSYATYLINYINSYPNTLSSFSALINLAIILSLETFLIFYRKNLKIHEMIHSYRLRYFHFYQKIKGKEKDSSFISNIREKLKENVINSDNKILSFFSREFLLILSVPSFIKYFIKSFDKKKFYFWEEKITEYEKERITGKKSFLLSNQERKFLEFLESLRTDSYIPIEEKQIDKIKNSNLDENLKNLILNEMEEIKSNKEFKFFIENIPVFIPKYELIDKLYEEWKKSSNLYQKN